MLERLFPALWTARSSRDAVRVRAFGVIAGAILGFLTIATSTAQAETLTIQGSSTASSTLLTPHLAAIEAKSGQSLKIVGIRSDIGLLRLLARQAEFAIISTPLQQAIGSLQPNSPDLPYDKLMSFPVSRIRVAFAINPSNPVRKAALSFIRQVLSGKLANWKDLGGENLPIRVAYAQAGDGVTMSVAKELLDGKPFAPANPIRVAFSAQVIKVVEQEPRALGITQLGLITEHKLPELMTDNVIEQELSLVTLGDPTPQQQAVIAAVRHVAADLGMPVVR